MQRADEREMMDERGNPYPDEYKPRDERVGLGRRPAPPPAPAVAEAEMNLAQP